ncbi:solute carrier family 49 member 4-like [Oratosquilla oratoria]|uniref:solute carrier family 49 member 4-like n=1 Tax=Oratosquilla oratoria TaxID=337810 RepID=UPI003F7667CE
MLRKMGKSGGEVGEEEGKKDAGGPSSQGKGEDTPTETTSLLDTCKNSYCLEGLDVILCPTPPEIKSFKSRFWVLVIFSLLCGFQVFQWNTWGPISVSALQAFPDWSPETVAMMANWGTISFLVFVAPVCYMVQHKGLRFSALVCAAVMAAATLVRAFAFGTRSFKTMCHLSAIMIGMTSPIVLAAPPLLAAVWFPARERITATATMQVSCHVGILFSFLEPLLVRDREDRVSSSEIRSDIKFLMYTDAAIGLMILTMIIVYFPNLPPVPPSPSSHTNRLELRQSLKELIRKKSLWLLMISYGSSKGVIVVLIAILDFVLFPVGFSEKETMHLAITALLVSGLATLVSARYADRCYGSIKRFLLLLLLMGVCTYFWFTLLAMRVTYGHTVEVYLCVTICLSLTLAAVPLFFELSVETCYPASEMAVACFLTTFENLMGVILLLFFFFHGMGGKMAYVLLAGSLVALVPMFYVKEQYRRSSFDRTTEQQRGLPQDDGVSQNEELPQEELPQN